MPSFAKDIRPLFRNVDIEHMKPLGLDLSSYDDVCDRADDIYDQVSNGFMPPDQPWSQDLIQLFRDWMDGGMLP
jgi:hypothetical protein